MRRLASILTSMLIAAAVARPCDMITIGNKRVDTAAEIVRRADTIFRARALGYSVSPEVDCINGVIRFEVIEVVRGNRCRT